MKTQFMLLLLLATVLISGCVNVLPSGGESTTTVSIPELKDVEDVRARGPQISTESGGVSYKIPEDKQITYFEWSPDNKKISIMDDKYKFVSFFDVSKKKEVKIFEDFYQKPPSWSPDGKKVVLTNYSDFTIYDTGTWAELKKVPNSDYRYGSVEWSPDGTKLLILQGYHQDAVLLDAATLGELKKINIKAQFIKWSPDNTKIAAIETREIWDVSTGVILKKFPNTTYLPWEWSPDGKKLAIGGKEEIISVFDTSTWNEIKKINVGVRSFIWSGDSSKLVVASINTTAFPEDYKILAFDTSTWKESYIKNYSLSHVESKDNDRLVLGNTKSITIFDLKTGKELKKLEGFNGDVYGVLWTKDRKKFASISSSTSSTDEVRIFDAFTWKEIRRIITRLHFNSLITEGYFSPDGTKFAALSKNTITIYDI